MRRDAIPTQNFQRPKKARSCDEAKVGGAKMPKEEKKGKRKSKEEWTRGKEGRNRFSSPTPRLQCRSQLTDREEEKDDDDKGGDGASTFLTMDYFRGYEFQLKGGKFTSGNGNAIPFLDV